METRKRKPFSDITGIQNLTPLSVLRKLVASKPAASILKPNSASTNHELCPESSDRSNTSIGSSSVGATFNPKTVRFRHSPLAVSSPTSTRCSLQSNSIYEESKKEREAHVVVSHTPVEKRKDKVNAIALPSSSSCKLAPTDVGIRIQKAVRFSSSKEKHSDFRSETIEKSRKERESDDSVSHSSIMKRKDKGEGIAVSYGSLPIGEIKNTQNNVCNSSNQVEGQCNKSVGDLGVKETNKDMLFDSHSSGKSEKGEATLNSSSPASGKISEIRINDIADTPCCLLEKRNDKKKGILKHTRPSIVQIKEIGQEHLQPSNSLAGEGKGRAKSASTSDSLPDKTNGKRKVVPGGSSSAVTVKSRPSRKKRNAVGVSSCPPMTRSKKIRRDLDEAGDVNCSKSWTAPRANTRKRCWKSEEKSEWPVDFIREQKSYFDEVDNFELAVEEVSEDELE